MKKIKLREERAVRRKLMEEVGLKRAVVKTLKSGFSGIDEEDIEYFTFVALRSAMVDANFYEEAKQLYTAFAEGSYFENDLKRDDTVDEWFALGRKAAAASKWDYTIILDGFIDWLNSIGYRFLTKELVKLY